MSILPLRLIRSVPAGLVLLATLASALAATAGTEIPSPEKLLPEDTLALITAPDFAKAKEAWTNMPEAQLWNDPAMKPFKDRFLEKWREEIIQPFEKQYELKFDTYAAMLKGQVTWAALRNDPAADAATSYLMLLDTKDKKEQLKTSLAELRKKCLESGKTVRSQTIREIEFTVLAVASNDIPSGVRNLLPHTPEVQELGSEPEKKPAPGKSELFLGQYESLLIAGNSAKGVEKVVAALKGGNEPVLGGLAAYQADHAALFQNCPVYGWINAKALLEASNVLQPKKENPEAPNPFDVKPDKLLNAVGLAGLKTAAFGFRNSKEGSQVELFFRLPESARQGLLKVLVGEVKESGPPPFVPADAVKFQRWRIDARKTWAALEKLLTEVFPQATSVLNFLIDSANAYANQKQGGFDIRKNLIDNLGDDIITYDKAARNPGTGDSVSGPALFLIGSANAEQLSAALKGILVYLSLQASTPPEEREFLGRKIFSVQLSPMAFPLPASAKPAPPRTLNYAASGGYVAMSFDSATLEEFLRATDTQGKALRDAPGFAEAAQRVNGPGTTLFGYVNRLETTRAFFNGVKKGTEGSTNASTSTAAALVPGAASLAAMDQGLKGLMDFSLLPAFDSVSKYFYCTVYSLNTSVDGLAFRIFAPTPPTLKPSGAAK